MLELFGVRLYVAEWSSWTLQSYRHGGNMSLGWGILSNALFASWRMNQVQNAGIFYASYAIANWRARVIHLNHWLFWEDPNPWIIITIFWPPSYKRGHDLSYSKVEKEWGNIFIKRDQITETNEDWIVEMSRFFLQIIVNVLVLKHTRWRWNFRLHADCKLYVIFKLISGYVMVNVVFNRSAFIFITCCCQLFLWRFALDRVDLWNVLVKYDSSFLLFITVSKHVCGSVISVK